MTRPLDDVAGLNYPCAQAHEASVRRPRLATSRVQRRARGERTHHLAVLVPRGPHRGGAETRGGVRRRGEIDTGTDCLPREGVAAMTDYRARAWREDPWWVVEVEGVGATQAKSVDKIDHMARA